MSPRARRFAAAFAILAGLLLLGRVLTVFLAERWWAASVSPAAVVILTRRALLTLGLDPAGIVLAIAWFAAHARVALRVLADVPERDHAGNPGFRAFLSKPIARPAAFALAVVLGILTAGRMSEWGEAVDLAGARLQLGVTDQALGIDAGWFITRLPIWLRAQALGLTLVLLALSLLLGAYLLGGAIRLGRGPGLTRGARVHLGLLLALLACVIGTSQILDPYELAAGLPYVVAPGVVQLHRSVAFVMVGVCVAVAALSVIWAFRPMHSLAAGAWLALSAAVVGAYYLLPDTPAASGDPGLRDARARSERLAYGLDPMVREKGRERPVLSLWDADVVGRTIRSDSSAVGPVARGYLPPERGTRPVWIVVGGRSDSTAAYVLADDTTSNVGAPLTWRAGGAGPESGLQPLLRLGPQSVRPGAPRVAVGSRSGVDASSFGRRLVLAWALQSPGLFRAGSARVAWRLDPAERLRVLTPFVDWEDPRPWFDARGLHWILDGYVTSEVMPGARRQPWHGRRISYLRAGFVGVVDAETGATDVYLRPGADPLSAVWARRAAPLVRDSADIPPAVIGMLAYPAALLGAQADLLAEDRSLAVATDTGSVAVPGVDRRPLPGGRTGSWVVPIVDKRTGRLDLLLEGVWDGQRDRLLESIPDSTMAPEAPDVLSRRWLRFPFVQQMRDSVTATGSSFESGRVRYAVSPDGLVAYQPSWALDPRGRAALVLVTVARGDRIGAGHSLEEAWRNSRGEVGEYMRLSDEAAIVAEARRWLREADSAFREGDLAAFGRAFAALKSVLEPDRQKPPK